MPVKLLGILLLTVVVIWLGLQVKPRAFPNYPDSTPALTFVDLPDNLPPPVARYYNVAIGDQIPVIDSAVITGWGTLRFAGITFNGRLRFTHIAGHDYRHYIESTIFGLPILKVNETYIDGNAHLELPFATVESELKVDMAANLGLWGESMWLPSIFVTDSRVRWEAIDQNSARLIVPFGEDEDTFTVTFDPQTGLIASMEAMRWKDAGSEAKSRWMLEPLGWQRFHGMLIPSPAAATWEDEGQPWLVMTVEDIAYNVDITEYIRARGL